MFLKFPFPFTVCLFYNDNINIIIFFPQCIFSPPLSPPQFDNDLMSSLIARLEQVVEKQKLVCLLALEKNHCSLFGAWHALSFVIVSSTSLLPSTAQLQFMAHNKRYLGNSVYHIVHYVDGFGHANSLQPRHIAQKYAAQFV